MYKTLHTSDNYNLLVLAYANQQNQFLDEWEKSLTTNNIDYKIYGFGTKWQGFSSKLQYLFSGLLDLDKTLSDEEKNNLIVIACDAYDILFLQSNKVILDTYTTFPKNKIIIGCETYCKGNCFPNQFSCEESKHKLPYINSGFIMGPFKVLLNAFRIVVGFGMSDDQVAWGKYRSMFCNDIILDYNSNLILNMAYEDIDMYDIIKYNGKIFNRTNNNYPCVIHLPGQHRTYPKGEFIRNTLFPDRMSIPYNEYNKKKIEKYGKNS